MDLSPIGRAALRAREGDVLTAYKDSVGIWTIGVGVTTASGLIKVVPGLKITAAQSDALFAKAVLKYVEPVVALGVPLAQHQFDALVSLCYNIGPAAFARSTVARRLKARDHAGAAEAILMWNKPAEIAGRRQGEYDQFRTPYAIALPRARRGDKAPVTAPPIVTNPPVVTTPRPAAAPGDNPQPAPTGGLVRSGVQATGGAVRSGLAGLYDLIHTAFRKG